jgi:hypothetical protein
MRNSNVTRFQSAPERSVGLCFRSLPLLSGHFLKRRGHELLFQFMESMRISGIMHSQSPVFGRSWCTRLEAQKQTTMALVVMCRDCLAPMWASFVREDMSISRRQVRSRRPRTRLLTSGCRSSPLWRPSLVLVKPMGSMIGSPARELLQTCSA